MTAFQIAILATLTDSTFRPKLFPTKGSQVLRMIGEDVAANLAEAFLRFRRARKDALPAEMFGEPAWEAMLELFVADARGQSVSARELARRCNASDKVMSSWLLFLTHERLIVGDGTGHLDDPITVSGKGMQRLEQTLAHAAELRAILDQAN